MPVWLELSDSVRSVLECGLISLCPVLIQWHSFMCKLDKVLLLLSMLPSAMGVPRVTPMALCGPLH